MKIKNRIYFYSFLSILFFFIGCTPINRITYMNENRLGEWDTSPIPPNHLLEIGDNLIVRIIIRDDELNSTFNINNNTNNSNPVTTAANLYINGYTTSQQGTIELPHVGEVFVLNQTIEEAKQSIEKKAKELLINPIIIVKLANFEFSVLGEVKSPGRYPVYKDNITIFEALAMAGDITDFGNLKKVKLIRSHKNKKEIYHIDLTDQKTLSSEYYYLRNDDLIYIQPSRFKGLRTAQTQIVLSGLTTIAILLNVYLNFNNQ